MARPDDGELAAYRAGTLPLARFTAVDDWLAAQPAAEQERLLGGTTPDATELRPDTAGLRPGDGESAVFTTERDHRRFALRGALGSGGMGRVELVHDRQLERDVALKRCRGRAPGESPESHALRLRLFRREAALTAQLEHPGIPPVHDVGHGPAGEPAYLLKRLTGTTLAGRVADGGPLSAAEAADLLLRVADALGFAHHRGVVHRDLKPEHLWLGGDGEVQVIDWGLAGAVGSTMSAVGAIGTPPWSAPEQHAETPADPRMDVWGLGGLLRFALSGRAPDAPAPPARGLHAIAARCLTVDPAARYPDGAAVAADLRRWLRDGIAAAERGGLAARAFVLLTRHRAAAVAGAVAILALAIAGGSQWWTRQAARQRADQRALAVLAAPLPDAAALRLWRDELDTMPRTPAVERAATRVAAALTSDLVLGAARRYQQLGPWPGEIADLSATLQHVGIDPLAADAAARLRTHPNHIDLLKVVAQLQRALLVGRVASPLTKALPDLVVAAAPDAAWTSLGDLLGRPVLRSHDLELCTCSDSEAALHQDDTADVLLALYAPDQRLAQLADERLAREPGAFWPRVVAGRWALGAGDFAAVRGHALVALGADPHSLWPRLLLAYAALAAGDDSALDRETAAGLALNPDHLELRALRAAWLARTGKRSEAQTLVDGLHEAAHFQFHLHHRSGQPMERTVDALVAAGVTFPEVAPEAGPVVRPAEDHVHPVETTEPAR